MRALGLLLAGVSFFVLGLAEKTVAVAPFLDRGSGLIGVDFGLAEMLEAKLREAGIPVIPARALESFRVGQNLPRTWATWKLAAASLGADLLLLGTLENLQTAQISIALGFLVLQGVSAQAEVSLVVWDVARGEAVATLREKGTGQGQATASFRFFFALPWDVCAGGFRTNKSAYLRGEPVLLGYVDPAPPRSFYVVIHPVAAAAPSWTSPVVSSSLAQPCVTWTWDGYFGNVLADPGLYQAELYDASNNLLIATRTFTIEDIFAGWAVELRFGAPEFAGTAWYQALASALDALVPKLLPILRNEPQG